MFLPLANSTRKPPDGTEYAPLRCGFVLDYIIYKNFLQIFYSGIFKIFENYVKYFCKIVLWVFLLIKCAVRMKYAKVRDCNLMLNDDIQMKNSKLFFYLPKRTKQMNNEEEPHV